MFRLLTALVALHALVVRPQGVSLDSEVFSTSLPPPHASHPRLDGLRSNLPRASRPLPLKKLHAFCPTRQGAAVKPVHLHSQTAESLPTLKGLQPRERLKALGRPRDSREVREDRIAKRGQRR